MSLQHLDTIYASCYCEENIYLLTQRLLDSTIGGELYVAIISNADGRFPLWRNRQRIGPENPEGLVVWDYHVILLHRSALGTSVYDFDSEMPWPCPLEDYVSHVLKSETFLNPIFHRLFRVISASAYLRDFRSDRSHMMAEDGVSYLMPVPSWPCLGESSKANCLPALYRMDTSMLGRGSLDTLDGRVMGQEDLLAFFNIDLG